MVLITGAYGQLGNELKLISNYKKNLKFVFTDVDTLDITSYKELKDFFARKNISAIVNCAAYTAVDKAEDEKEKAFLINVKGVENLSYFAENQNIPFIHISTDYVFDGKNFKPYTEEDEINPISHYGFTKAEGEKFVLKLNKGIVIRTSWLYSSYGKNFVKTMLKLASQNKILKVVSDQIGTPTYAEDLALVIMKFLDLLLIEKKQINGIFHYSNSGVASWYDFAFEILNISKANVSLNPILTKDFPTKAKRPFYSVLDKSKITKTLNIKIPHWKKSLKKCLKILNS